MIKKIDVYTFIAVLLCCVGLVLQNLTGLNIHIGLGALTAVIIFIHALKTYKDTKTKALDTINSLLLLAVVVSGLMMQLNGVSDVLKLVHLIAFVLFVVAYVITFVVGIKRSTHKQRRR